MDPLQINLKKIEHNGKDRILLGIPYNSEILYKVKELPDCKWSQTYRSWHIPFSEFAIKALKNKFPEVHIPLNISNENNIPLKVESIIKTIEYPIPPKTFRNTNYYTTVEVHGDLIKIKCDKNENDVMFIRSLKLIRWDKELFAWMVPYSDDNVELIKNHFTGRIKDIVIIEPPTFTQEAYEIVKRVKEFKPVKIKNNGNTDSIHNCELTAETIQKVKAFENWMHSRRYSDSTVSTYTDALRTFLKYYHKKSVSEITNNDIILFNNDYILKNNLSASFQNQIVNAVKLFFIKIENTKIDVEIIHRPKRAKVLPNVLSKEEVKMILNALGNIKHKAMLSLIYSCGLRCGELLRLKPEHIDSKRSIIIIKQSKGRKDRIAPLSLKIIDLLRDYYTAFKPTLFLFEGRDKGEPYDVRSLQQVLKLSLAKTGITKPVSLHWLRHSYATHLLENGTDLRYIQEILGHSSSKTTEIYTHVSTKNIQNITSPFDYL